MTERGPLSDKAFPKFAKKFIPFCHVDGDHDPGLRKKLFKSGIPVVAFLDAEGQPVLTARYPHSVDAWSKRAKEAREFVDTRRKAGTGDAPAQRKFFLLQLRHGKLNWEEAKKSRPSGFSQDENQLIENHLLSLQAADMVRKCGRDPKSRRETGRIFADWLKNDRVPEEPLGYGFWYMAFEYAQSAGDDKAFRLAETEFRKRHGDKPWAKNYLQRLKK